MPRKNKYPVAGLERISATGWRYKRMVDGEVHRVSFKARTEAQAVQTAMRLAKRGNLALNGSWEKAVERYVVEAQGAGRLSDAYGRSRRNVLKKAARDMGAERPDQITPSKVERWFQAVIDERGGSTANRYLAHLSVFSKWMIDRGWMLLDPTEGIEKVIVQRKARDVFVSAEVVSALLEAAKEEGDPELELILLLGFECGMRHGEISSAAASWVDLKAGLITIPATEAEDGKRGFRRKGREGRRRAVTVPMVEELREWFVRNGVPEPFLLRPDITWGEFEYRYEGWGSIRRRHGSTTRDSSQRIRRSRRGRHGRRVARSRNHLVPAAMTSRGACGS